MSQVEETPVLPLDAGATTDEVNETVESSVKTDATKPGVPIGKKRKQMKLRSFLWDHFVKKVDEEGYERAACKYCKKEFFCNSKVNGTSNFKHHAAICRENPHNKDTHQAQISLQSGIGSSKECEKMGTISNWKYDESAIRIALCKMIVLDEFPFKFIEGTGFKLFMSIACPRFHIPSRWTIGRDIYQLYLSERKKLRDYIKTTNNFVCLTTDTWTSCQKINYMCLTVHWIANDWRLNKIILNFVPISSHRGEDLGRMVEGCLQEWGIEKVLTITVNNASSNDVMVSYLRKKISNWGSTVLQGQYLHMRCVAHIINLVVHDGLKEHSNSVVTVRNAVRYVKQSPARWAKWKACMEKEKIVEIGKDNYEGLCLDVATRWNCTFLMLNAARICQKAFERYEEEDPMFKNELEHGGGRGVPSEEHWSNIERLCTFLETFYYLTLRVSGTLYVTSNLHLHEITNVDCLMQDMQLSTDFVASAMARRMKEKYDKYWGNYEKINMFIFIPIVLDPRHKMEFVKFAILEMFNGVSGDMMVVKVEKVTRALYNEYRAIYEKENGRLSNTQAQTSTDKENESLSKLNVLQSRFKRMKASSLGDGS